jgi:hypothetical protein
MALAAQHLLVAEEAALVQLRNGLALPCLSLMFCKYKLVVVVGRKPQQAQALSIISRRLELRTFF